MVKRVNGTNKMPGGRLHQFEIDPTWVLFATNSSLVQSDSVVVDTSKVTISLGFRIPADFLFAEEILLVSLDPIVSPVSYPIAFKINYVGGSNTIAVVALGVNGLRANSGEALILNSTALATRGDKHHLFVSLDTNHGAGLKVGNLYIDGVNAKATTGDSDAAFTMGVLGSSFGLPLSDVTKVGGPLYNPDHSLVTYSYVQVWFGLCIDPGTVESGGTQAKDGQPAIITELVDGANNYGLDPLIVLTYADIESIFGRNDSPPYYGMFQFSQAEMNYAASRQPGTGTNLFRTADQMDAFYYYYTNPARGGAFVTWQSILNSYGITSDPTGVYHYLAHNQGPGGFNAVLNNLSGQTIGSLGNTIARNLLNQPRWAHGMNRSTTVAAWWASLQSVWNTVRAANASKLTTGGIPNIEYFYKDGLLRTPYVAQQKFGQSDVLFGGVAADMIVNQGSSGDFDVEQLIGITDEA